MSASGNSDPVTWRELKLVLDSVDRRLSALEKEVRGISDTLGAGRRWLLGRATMLIDRAILLGLAAVIALLVR
jgi:hypothetical protein